MTLVQPTDSHAPHLSLCSGTHCRGKNRPSIMSWPARRGSCTCSYTQAGRRGTTMGRRRGGPGRSTKNPTQITLFTIPRRKKKCIRYLPGEGRCPSPVPSDDSALGCPGSPNPQDSPSYLLLPHFPTALLASPAEPGPTSPGLSATLSLPAPWAPTGPPQCPVECTGTATAISETGSLACTGHLASRSPPSEKKRQSPKACGNRPGVLLTPSQGPGSGDCRGCTTSA